MAKHVLADQLSSRAGLIDRLQSLLLEEQQAAVREVCKEMRFDIGDLRPKSRDSFGAVNVPNDIKDMRFEHFEERRVAKLLTIAGEVLARHPSTLQLALTHVAKILHLLGASSPPKSAQFKTFEGTNQTQSSAYGSPLDKFRSHIDREKVKFEKAAKTYAAFVQHAERDQEQRYEQDWKRQERDQKRLAELKKSQDDKHARFDKIHVRRERNSAQKRNLVKEHDKEMYTLGKTLQEKLRASTARRRFHSSAHSLDRKSLEGMARSHTASMSPSRAHGREDEVEAKLRQIEEKLGNHARRLEESREERLRRTRDHLDKVRTTQINRTCELVQENRAEMEEEQLRKAVEKGAALQSRRSAKQSFFQSIAQKTRSTMEKREAKHVKQLQEVVKQEREKISQTTQKQRDKEKALKQLVQSMKRELLRKAEQKTLRKQDQQENFLREAKLMVRTKQEEMKLRVLEKHQHASDVVEAMEMQKKELMEMKLRNEMELKRLREVKAEAKPKERKSQGSPKKEEVQASA